MLSPVRVVLALGGWRLWFLVVADILLVVANYQSFDYCVQVGCWWFWAAMSLSLVTMAVTSYEYVRLLLQKSTQAKYLLKSQTVSVRMAQQVKSKRQELASANKIFEAFFDLLRKLSRVTKSAQAFALIKEAISDFAIPYNTLLFVYRDKPHHRVLYSYIEDSYCKDALDMAALSGQREPFLEECFVLGRPTFSGQANRQGLVDISANRIFSSDQSVVCVPLHSKGRASVAIYLGCAMPNAYNEQIYHFLSVLASAASALVLNLLDKEDTQQRLELERHMRLKVEEQKRQLEGLQEMVHKVGQTPRPDYTVQTVLGTVGNLIPSAQRIVIFLSDSMLQDYPLPDGMQAEMGWGYKYVAVAANPASILERHPTIQPKIDFLGQVLAVGKRIVVDDFSNYSYKSLFSEDRSAVGLPLRVEKENLGCIYVSSNKRSAFSDSEIRTLQTIVSQASLAVKNAALMERLRNQAITDGLTGLYTHRYFKEQLNLQVQRCQEEKGTLSLIMFDADHFKEYNDTLGHPAGDMLLRRLSSLIKESVRSDDIVCRQGGDEFTAILIDCPKEQAIPIAKAIRSKVEEAFKREKVAITTSIGLANFPQDARDAQALVKSADTALYKSKNGGRNQVNWARGPAIVK